MKDAFYFSHDCNARHDPKILALRSVYGMEGYGRYWILIEMLREQSDYRIMLTKYVWNALAMQMQCSASEAEEFVQNCINEFRLFQSDGKAFWSESLFRRMSKKDAKTDQARNAAKARWNKEKQDSCDADLCEANADAMQTQCGSNAIKEKKEKKEEESKENNNTRAHEAGSVDNFPAETDWALIKTISEDYRPLSPAEMLFLSDWQNTFPDEVILDGVRRAYEAGKLQIGYMRTIFTNWQQQVVKTMDDVHRLDALWDQKKNKQSASRDKPDNKALDYIQRKLAGGG